MSKGLMMSTTLRTPALALLALSLHSSRQLVLGSTLSLTNASPAAALRLVGWTPLRRSLQDDKKGNHQLRGSAPCLALRGGAGGDTGGSSSENVSNISGLTSLSLDSDTPSQFDAMDLTAEDMKGVPGISKEQAMKEMLEGRPDMLLPHNFTLEKANKKFNSPIPDMNRSSSFSEEISSEHDSGEFMHGIPEVRTWRGVDGQTRRVQGSATRFARATGACGAGRVKLVVRPVEPTCARRCTTAWCGCSRTLCSGGATRQGTRSRSCSRLEACRARTSAWCHQPSRSDTSIDFQRWE